MKIKKWLALLLMSSVSNVYAIGPGCFTGINIGYGRTQVKQSGGGTSSSSGLAGGVDLGYQFNPYSAFSLGYTHWPNGNSNNVPSCGSTVIHNDSANLLGRGIMNIAGFGFFGEGGLGILRSSGGGSCGTSNQKTTTSLKPLLGLGVSYDVSQTVVAELAYTQMFANTNQVKNLSMLSLGISFHNTDVYCGQFLA